MSGEVVNLGERREKAAAKKFTTDFLCPVCGSDLFEVVNVSFTAIGVVTGWTGPARCVGCGQRVNHPEGNQ
jgi:transcription elongation factor Elf1